MPLYLDVHNKIEGLTKEGVADTLRVPLRAEAGAGRPVC